MLRPRRMVLSRIIPCDPSVRRYVIVFFLAQIDKSRAKLSLPLSEHLLKLLYAVEFMLIRAGWSNLNRAESLRCYSIEVSRQMTLLHLFARRARRPRISEELEPELSQRAVAPITRSISVRPAPLRAHSQIVSTRHSARSNFLNTRRSTKRFRRIFVRQKAALVEGHLNKA